MQSLTYAQLESGRAKQLVKNHESFQIVGLGGRMSSAVTLIENVIESQNMKCRVYIYGRLTAALTTVIGGIPGLAGFISAIGMTVHNLATFNPDYEIAKHKIDNKLSVNYKH